MKQVKEIKVGEKIKFYHVDEPQTIYTAELEGYTMKISWDDPTAFVGNGYCEESGRSCTYYAPILLTQYVKEGTWIIIE
jgi:hypothetical protein